MIIKRVSCQSRSLEEFYGETAASEDPSRAAYGEAMCRLLVHLRDHVQGPDLWGLTSHLYLFLKALDAWEEPSLVCIRVDCQNLYVISFPMKRSESPWPGGASVSGYAATV